jgi:opacity protein-like surface antigen
MSAMKRKFLMTTLALPLLAMSMPVIAQYQSVAPPGEHTATPAPDALELLHIDPKNGQTPEREWADRYACHGWATSQSGFDPGKRASGPSDDNTSRRGAYLRAMTACLEARGYSMRDVAPTPYTPPVAAAPPPGWTPVEHASPQRSEFKYHPLVVQIEGGYSLTTGATHQNLDNGSNVGVGVAWFPTSVLPLGLRVDGSYSGFSETPRSVNLASLTTGTNASFGHAHLYGGDVDAELDLQIGSHVKEYYFGGVGAYREQTTFKQLSYESGVGCDFYECFYGYFPVTSTVERNTTGWLHSWNAGLGFEFALQDPASFFVEARYVRIGPPRTALDFVPIRVGLRF